MERTDRPKSGQTTYHRDGTVTVWDCRRSEWVRGSNLSDDLLSTLTMERPRIMKHVARGHDLMKTYLVYRHGANAANQGYMSKAPVAIVTANTAEEAITEAMADGELTVYNNQHLSAVPREEADESDWNYIRERDAEEIG